MRIGYLAVLFISLTLSAQEQSVLSKGEIYQLRVTSDGLYKIDYAQLKDIGIMPGVIDPERIRIFGNGAGMLPQSNEASRPYDLLENSIKIVGDSDGSFDSGDYILFYAEGPHQVKYDVASEFYYYENHLYSSYNYYYLIIGDEPGSRVGPGKPIYQESAIENSYQALYWHKLDSFNILSSGRKWFGERFYNGDQFELDYEGFNPVENTDLKIRLQVMSRSTSQSTFQMKVNEMDVGIVQLAPAQTSTYGYRGREQEKFFRLPTNGFQDGAKLKVSLAYDDPGDSNGYLHQLMMNVEQPIQLSGNQLVIRSASSTNNVIKEFSLHQPVDDLQVWDLRKQDEISELVVTQNGINQTFKVSSNGPSKLLLFTGDEFPAPEVVGAIDNQNLKALDAPELLVITAPSFLKEAERLAEFRSGNDNISTQVVSTGQIYHEFSSGKQDITAIRDFIRYLYLKQQRLKYVLLFGDASYDYKNIKDPNLNVVPTYQSRQSLHDIHSYGSDDYFGFMDENEGEWLENASNSSSHLMDLGIGRLPVNSEEEASDLVDKIISYQSVPEGAGNWRQTIVMVADDGESNKFQLQSDFLTNKNDERRPEYSSRRLYLDNQLKERNGDVTRSPLIRQELLNTIDKGALLVDFIGHGGETAWTNEQILDGEFIQNLTNEHLPVFMTATCEFGRFDDWQRTSGAENLLLKSNGGAIALFTTARPMFLNTNFDISKAFHASFFTRDSLNNPPRLGDIMRETKNQSVAGTVNRNFTLLGDPSMPLNFPKNQVIIEKINGEQMMGNRLRPLSTVELEGVIQSEGSILMDFNGIVDLILYDGRKEISTLGQGTNQVMAYQDWTDLLFQGQAVVESGRFKINFTLPADISPDSAQGKISLYAYDQENNRDAGGGTFVTLGGAQANLNDKGPPDIRLYLNHLGFKSGDRVDNSPLLIAFFEDNSGINLSDSRGNGILLTIDDNEPFSISRYFLSDPDLPTKGQLEYQLSNLEPGSHRLKLSVSDVANNKSEQMITFIVGGAGELLLTSVVPTPNPSSMPYTEFHFRYENASENEELGVLLNIYDSKGILVESIDAITTDHQAPMHILRWEHNQKNISSGLYFYRFFLRSIHYHPGRSSGKVLLVNP